MDLSTILVVSVIIGVVFGIIGSGICQLKGRSVAEGFIPCLILGIMGLIIVAALPENAAAIQKKNINDGTSNNALIVLR